jgi:hypothetical protein
MQYTMKAYGGLTSLLVGGEWSAPGLFNPGGSHWIGGWLGPRGGLNDPLRDLNTDPLVVRLVASRHTDYAIPAHIIAHKINLN